MKKILGTVCSVLLASSVNHAFASNELAQDLERLYKSRQENVSKIFEKSDLLSNVGTGAGASGSSEEGGNLSEVIAEVKKTGSYNTVLSIDGGGVRGYIPALLLDKVERVTNKKIHELFDFVGGTSIGGIEALGLCAESKTQKGHPVLTTDELINIFKHKSNKIFPKEGKLELDPTEGIWGMLFQVAEAATSYVYKKAKDAVWSQYNHEPLEGLLKGYFKDQKLDKMLTDVLVTSVNTETRKPVTFNSAIKEYQGCKLWDIGRATSAAPTYFEAHKVSDMHLVDGGLYANNPTILTYDALNDKKAENDEFILPQNTLVVSLGTGQIPPKESLISDGYLSDDAGWARAAAPVIDLMMTASSNGVHDILSRRNKSTGNYLRADPKIEKYFPLDDASDDNLQLLARKAEEGFGAIEEFFSTDGKFRKRLEEKD